MVGAVSFGGAWQVVSGDDRSPARCRGVGAQRVLVLLPDGTVLAASDPLRHPLGAMAPEEAGPGPLRLAPGADTAWIHRAVSEGGAPMGRIAAERRATVLALVGVNAALTLLFAILGWLLVRRMLRPVLRLSERLSRAAEGRLEPIPEAELPPADTEAGRYASAMAHEVNNPLGGLCSTRCA